MHMFFMCLYHCCMFAVWFIAYVFGRTARAPPRPGSGRCAWMLCRGGYIHIYIYIYTHTYVYTHELLLLLLLLYNVITIIITISITIIITTIIIISGWGGCSGLG